MAETEQCICAHVFSENKIRWEYSIICPKHFMDMHRRGEKAMLPQLPEGIHVPTESKSKTR